MTKHSTPSILAAYATLKSLSDEKKYQSPYQILKEFIRYIIINENLYSFSSIEIKNQLTKHFGFLIPEAVIKTSLKNMSGVILNNKKYDVNISELGTDSLFENKKRTADSYELSIIQKLSEYISNRTGNAYIDEVQLSQELTSFLTEDISPSSMNYIDLIGEFILKNEHDKDIQTGLDNIRGGSILYIGLCHNIRETGSITKPLTIYLGTEILFSLVGFNGEIFKQFANDFINQVRIANSGKMSKIKLLYFHDTKKEIEDFFSTASDIVEGNRHRILDKQAMKAITNGCNTASDVDIKKSDFYHQLQYSFDILEDPHNDYYQQKYFSTNLEDYEYEGESDINHKKEMAIKLIGNINKLRNGNTFQCDIDSEYIFVTNSKITLLISKEQTDRIKSETNQDNICNFAISLDRVTSLLWYKLGNGFANNAYPSSVSAVLKARIILSSSIAKKAEKAFKEVKKQYDAGVITENQLVARICTLKNKPSLPENLQKDDIDEIMDFSPEYLSRFEEQFKSNQDALKEKDDIIELLKSKAHRELSEKDATITTLADIINEKDAETIKLRSELTEYQLKEKENAREKERNKRRFRIIRKNILKFILLLLLIYSVKYLEETFNFTIPSYLYTVSDIVAFIVLIINTIKNIKNEYQDNTTE